MEIDEKDAATESSPVAVAVETEVAPPEATAVEDLTSSQREKWLSTGELPKAKKDAEDQDSQPDKEETKDDDKTEESSPSTEFAEEVAESAPAKVAEKAEIPPSEARIKDLVAKNKILEQRLANLERQPAKVEALAEEKAPNPEHYETMGEYLEAKVSFEVSQGIRKSQAEREAVEQKSRIETQNKEIISKWNERVVEAQKKYKDFSDKVFDGSFNVLEGSVLDTWALKSKFGTDVLYYYATHPAEFAKLNQITDPVEAGQEIARLEVGILEKPKPAPKLVSSAPKPPSEVSGRGTATDDPIAEALASGDISKYMRLANEKERAGSRK